MKTEWVKVEELSGETCFFTNYVFDGISFLFVDSPNFSLSSTFYFLNAMFV